MTGTCKDYTVMHIDYIAAVWIYWHLNSVETAVSNQCDQWRHPVLLV